MDIVVQWATILSPIIAVVIACWTIKSSAKDVAKQIASIKEVAKIQIETTQILLKKELWDAKTRYGQTSNRILDENTSSIFNYLGGVNDSMRQKVDKNRDLTDNKEYYSQQVKILNQYLTQLNDLGKRLEGE